MPLGIKKKKFLLKKKCLWGWGGNALGKSPDLVLQPRDGREVPSWKISRFAITRWE